MITYNIKSIILYDQLRNEYTNEYFIVKSTEQYPDLYLPSPLTYFVLKYGKSLNTKKKFAETLCSFINYVIRQVEVDANFLSETDNKEKGCIKGYA